MMPLTRRGLWGWSRSDQAPYGDSGTLGPFGCIGLSAKRLVIDYLREFGPQTCLGEDQSGSMAGKHVDYDSLVEFDLKSTPLMFKLVHF
jgi:hypothetical protein